MTILNEINRCILENSRGYIKPSHIVLGPYEAALLRIALKQIQRIPDESLEPNNDIVILGCKIQFSPIPGISAIFNTENEALSFAFKTYISGDL